MITTIVRRLVWISALALLPGCALAPDLSKPEGRREAAMQIVERLGEKRDRAPHDNPRASEIDRAFIEAYASAATPHARSVALVRLIDQFSDGHAWVQPPFSPDLMQAPDCTIGTLAGSLWLEFSGRDVIEGLPESGRRGRYCVELLEIDGYAPRGRSAAFSLLMGPSDRPVRVRCRMLRSGELREITLGRNDDAWEVRFADDDHGAPAKAGTVLASHPGFPDTVRAELLSEEPRIGLVRLPWMSRPERSRDGDAPLDLDCVAFHKPCEDLRAMIGLFEAVADCDWIIVDLQGGSGGSCVHAGAIAAAIMPTSVDPLPFEHLDCPTVLKLLGNTPWGWERKPVVPSTTRFAVLIDERCLSASEHIAGVLRALPSTILVGARSAGAEYSLDRLVLPDGTKIHFGGNPGIWRGLDIVEGRGIPPQVPVAHDLDILRTKGIRACTRDHRARSLAAAVDAIRTVEAAH